MQIMTRYHFSHDSGLKERYLSPTEYAKIFRKSKKNIFKLLKSLFGNVGGKVLKSDNQADIIIITQSDKIKSFKISKDFNIGELINPFEDNPFEACFNETPIEFCPEDENTPEVLTKAYWIKRYEEEKKSSWNVLGQIEQDQKKIYQGYCQKIDDGTITEEEFIKFCRHITICEQGRLYCDAFTSVCLDIWHRYPKKSKKIRKEIDKYFVKHRYAGVYYV